MYFFCHIKKLKRSFIIIEFTVIYVIMLIYSIYNTSIPFGYNNLHKNLLKKLLKNFCIDSWSWICTVYTSQIPLMALVSVMLYFFTIQLKI